MLSILLLQAQFFLILIHNLNALFSECSYPKLANILMCLNSILFINLFGKFFYASYLKRPAKNGTVKNGTAKNGTTKNGTAKNNTAKNGSVTNETDKSESVTNGTGKNGVHWIGSTNSFNEKATDKNGVTLNGKHKDV